jgi:hypothetical protein
VIGHIERGESRVNVRAHGRRRAIEVEAPPVALHVGQLPKAGEDARD